MNTKEPLYETKISDARWWAYDIPGNAGCELSCQKPETGYEQLQPGGAAAGKPDDARCGELISERIAGLDRVLPKGRLLRGFGVLTLGGLGGGIVSALGLATQKEKRGPAIMLIGSVLCAVFAGLCWKGYRKR